MKLKLLNKTNWFNRCRKIKGFAALLALIFAFSTNLVSQEVTLQTVDFETAAGYFASPAESNANTSDPDYWIRTNGATPTIYPEIGFTTSNGTYFFAAEDLDNVPAGAYTVTCDATSVSGYSDLQIKLLVGGRSDISSGIEGEEYIKIQYNMDGGGWITRAQFIGDNRINYYEDANADGTIDGPAITTTLSEFTYSIPVTGSSLQVRIEVYCGGGEEVAFDYIRVLGTVAASTPSATTNPATSVTTTGATLNGTVNANGADAAVTFEYGLTTSYGSTVTADQSPVTGFTGTAVSKAISSLSPNTTYHFRVVGVNSEGTTNGLDGNFTTLPLAATVTTQAATSITQTTATGNGNITSLGAPNPTAHGVCWNTSGTPTTADNNTNDGAAAATGAFTSNITGLSANTLYYVRAYATNTAGTTYGSQVSFTTDPEAPTVTTQAVTSITMTTAIGNGNITDLGAPNPTAHGVCWNTGGTPTTGDSKTTEGVVSAIGSFTSSITSLSPNTTYYVRAYATNAAGISYGNQVSFTTDPEPATVTTQALTNITQTTATGNGNITDLGVPNPTQHGVCWNTGGTPTTGDSKTTEGVVSATGAFTSSITSLSPNTTYYIRAYATNTAGTSYGNQVSFTTDPEEPTVTTQAVTNITSTSVTANGNITDLGVPNPTQHGFCYNITGSPSLSDSHVDLGAVTITGAFSTTINFLDPVTTYYIRAYATNIAGTAYGDEVSFTTPPVAASVTTQAVTDISFTTATGNGNITDLGVPNPTQYGVCWNTGGAPTTDDNSTNEGAASITGAFTSSMTSLIPNTTYYVRAYATNTAGTSYGNQVSFATFAQAPTAATNSATGITAVIAILNGSINANNASTTVTFEYGLTDSYGSTVTANESPVTGTSDTPVSYELTGLSPNTTYHYRVVGVNDGGTSNGDDLTFTTLSQDPIVITNAASNIDITEAVLNATVNANDLSTTVTFEYGTTDSYGTTVTADESPVTGTTGTEVIASITGLNPNATYHFRVVGVNSAGTTNGNDLTFTTTKYNQLITFTALANKTTNDVDFDPGATSDLGLIISYASSNELVATIVSNQIHIVGAGTTKITASQAGNDTVNVATPVEQSLTVTQTTGLENPVLTNLKLFPNPVRDVLNIKIGNLSITDNVTISIFDLTGKTVFSKNYTDADLKVDVSNLNPGLYFVTIKTSDNIRSLKVIKE